MTYQIRIIVLLLLTGFFTFQLSAQPGALDTDFGNGGIIKIDIEGRVDRFMDVTSLTNGDLLAVGVSKTDDEWDYILAKFDRQGAPIRSFGKEGLIRDKFGSGGYHDALSVSLDGQQNAFVAINSYSHDVIHIIKLNPEGILDSSFANQGSYTFGDTSRDWSCNLVYVHPNQDIYVASESGALISLFKLDATGQIDSSFGTDGIFVIDKQHQVQRVYSMVSQEDGKLLICGEASTNIGWRGFLMRLNAEGTFDSTFAGTGYIVDNVAAQFSRSGAVAVQKDGKILIAGSLYNGTINDAYFKRFLVNGQLDVSFGNAGELVLPTGGNNVMYSVDVLANNSILAAGDRAIIRMMSDGSTDSSFDNDGMVDVTPLYIAAMSLDDQENIIVVGGEATGMFVAKYKSGQSTTNVIIPAKGFNANANPVPFSANLTLSYSVPSSQLIKAELYNANGIKVQTLLTGQYKENGSYSEPIRVASWLPAGPYFVKFQVGDYSELLKVIKQ